ncbi:MAG: HAD-IIA family hydrolase [Clostridia bacterium]|nr:HAD-IIA family hydrolase [Clostridia bacterium]
MNRPLKDKEMFILDMDGTFYLDNTPVEGALGFIEFLKSKNKGFLFFTNNSSKSITDYVLKLRNMGVAVDDDDIFSSGAVAIDFINKNRKGKSVYVIGTKSLSDSFADAGIALDDSNPGIVLLGFDTTLTYEKIYKGCTFIRNGAEFIATHPDSNCPVEGGLMPDTGSMIKMFTESTGVEPLVMGKPHVHTVEALEAKTGVGRGGMVFVGDRLQTDIAIGVNNGAASVLVMTGATSPKMLIESKIKPSFTVPSISYIKDLI